MKTACCPIFYLYLLLTTLLRCCVLLVVLFYLAVWPIGVTPNAEDFWASYISVPLILVLYVIGKVVYKTPKWVNLDTVDLDYGRRFYADEPEKKESGNFLIRGLKSIVQ